MPSDIFWVFQKIKKELYKEKCKTVKKIKSVKSVIIKSQLHTKAFQVCINIV